jgi:hypothetical protein
MCAGAPRAPTEARRIRNGVKPKRPDMTPYCRSAIERREAREFPTPGEPQRTWSEVLELKIRHGALPVALFAALLAVGTAFAAAPSFAPPPFAQSHHPDPAASASASHEAEASATVEESAAAERFPKAEESAKAEESESAESAESPGASPSDRQIAAVLADLQAAGIPATADQIRALAAKVGLGGAVRVLSFANASGKTPDEILAMFESGQGWGQIAAELDLTIGPGIGGIMSGGHGGNPKLAAAASPSPSPVVVAGKDHGQGKNHGGGDQ